MADTTEKIKKVKITLPRASGSAPRDVFVSVNGVNYIVPRGQEVEVPDYVAAEIERASRAEAYMQDEKDRMKQEQSK